MILRLRFVWRTSVVLGGLIARVYLMCFVLISPEPALWPFIVGTSTRKRINFLKTRAVTNVRQLKEEPPSRERRGSLTRRFVHTPGSTLRRPSHCRLAFRASSALSIFMNSKLNSSSRLTFLAKDERGQQLEKATRKLQRASCQIECCCSSDTCKTPCKPG